MSTSRILRLEMCIRDRCGWVGQIGYGSDTAWAVNVYTAGEPEQDVMAAGFYATEQNTDYEVYVVPEVSQDPEKEGYRSFEMRRKVASGHLDHAGYYTVSFDRPLVLQPGRRFGVMIKLTTPGAVHPVAIESVSYTHLLDQMRSARF